MVSSSKHKNYDVFISFRGEDTRDGFTSHLYEALNRNKFHTYIDYKIEKGKQVWSELVEAIKDSTLFLIVFSKEYASSTWCLSELVEIMECNKNEQVCVIPVFYHVDPSHVRKQTGCFGTAFAKHKKKDKDKIQKWKDVLCEAANLSGFQYSTSNGTETQLIEKITKSVSEKLKDKHPNELKYYFIPDENYSEIDSLIKNDSREVQIIGLWGMGGIGKTTHAYAIFQKFSSKYQGSCFLEIGVEESKTTHGLNNICNRLISSLLRDNVCIYTHKVIPSMVRRKLKCMKVFIVMDGLNTSELVQNLMAIGRDSLGDGSKIIVTSRDKEVLISGEVDQIYEVKKMNFESSLQLFSYYALRKSCPENGYVSLSKRAIDYAKGNPLTLKILGSSLRFKSEEEWDSALTKLKVIPNAEIQKVLRWSYNELDDLEQNIFLDIACFFKGHKRERVTKILNDCGFFANIGIRHLLDKALIRDDSENCVQMHDLIQEMGKQIVREESPKNPGEHSRLWGTMAVEAVLLDMTEIAHINLNSKVFKKMPNLRLLAFRDREGVKSVSLPKGLDSLPMNLRYLEWDGYPLKSLPSTFSPEMLVELSLRDSIVEKLWNGTLHLPGLERLDLSGSKSLVECPNLSGSPNLKDVNFLECKKLAFIDPSIFSPKLEVLNAFGCTSLKSISSNTCSPTLRELHVQCCINLQEFSVKLMPSNASSLQLSIGWWGLNRIPSSIMHMRNIKAICFPISDSLMDLPENFTRTFWLFQPWKYECTVNIPLKTVLSNVLHSQAFINITRLVIRFCHSLFGIPENIYLLSSLQCLILFGCAIESLPETIKYLSSLKHLDIGKCRMLEYIPALPESIQFFCVWDCESLHSVLLSSTIKLPSEKSIKLGFCFLNCTNLNPLSNYLISDDVFVLMENEAILHNSSIIEVESEDDDDDDALSTALHRIKTLGNGIWYLLPAMGMEFVDYRFHYHSKQSLVCVEELWCRLYASLFRD